MMGNENAVQNPERLAAANMKEFSEVSQVAWIRVGALGDLLVSLANLKETLEKFPRANVWIFGPKLWLQILEPHLWSRVNGIVVIEGSCGRLHTPLGRGWKAEVSNHALGYFFKKCQASINLRVESYRYAWGPFFAGVRFRFGTCPWAMKWLYTHWSPWLGKDPIIHERDRMLEILEAAPTSVLSPQPTQKNRDDLKQKQTGEFGKKAEKYKVFQPNQDKRSLAYKWRYRALPQIVLANPVELREKWSLEPNSYWLVNPTSSRWEKAWSKDKFKEFCARIEDLAIEKRKKIVIVGAPNETEWLSYVADQRFLVVQPSSIRELANVVCLAELLITNTSSVQYIAACTKTPTLTLMGRTFPARWGPLGAKDRFIAGRVPVDFRGNIFEEDYAGYDSITIDEARTSLEGMLKFI